MRDSPKNRGGCCFLRLSLAGLVILPLTGMAYGADTGKGGDSAGINVTARIVTCLPVITTTDYSVTVTPAYGEEENAATSGKAYFPAQVAIIDNSKCDYDVDITGKTPTDLISSPNVVLENINARISLVQDSGHIGDQWTMNGANKTTATVKAGTRMVLFAGINPLTGKTAYIKGSGKGAITLTLTPH